MLTEQLTDAVAKAAKDAVVGELGKDTIKQIQEAIGLVPALAAVTLGDLLGGGAEETPSKPRRGRPKKKAPPKPKKDKPKKAGSKKEKGKKDKPKKAGSKKEKEKPLSDDEKKALDTKVLDAVGALCEGDNKAASSDIQSDLGESAYRVRTSLKRLIDAKKVKVEGQKRATRYNLA